MYILLLLLLLLTYIYILVMYIFLYNLYIYIIYCRYISTASPWGSWFFSRPLLPRCARTWTSARPVCWIRCGPSRGRRSRGALESRMKNSWSWRGRRRTWVLDETVPEEKLNLKWRKNMKNYFSAFFLGLLQWEIAMINDDGELLARNMATICNNSESNKYKVCSIYM